MSLADQAPISEWIDRTDDIQQGIIAPIGLQQVGDSILASRFLAEAGGRLHVRSGWAARTRLVIRSGVIVEDPHGTMRR